MDSKVKVSIIVVILTILMIIMGTPLVSPEVVKASDLFRPYIDPGTSSVSAKQTGPNDYEFDILPIGIGLPFSVYYDNTYNNVLDVFLLSFNVNRSSTIETIGDYKTNYFSYIHDGVVYTIYYSTYSSYGSGSPLYPYESSCSGTKIFSRPNNEDQIKSVCLFFLFGVGDLDYELPAQDIPDSDLDIKGLSCTVLNDQQASVQVAETMKNIWDRNVAAWYSFIFDSPKDYISKGRDNSGVQFIQNYVPGVSLIWDSPPVNQVADQVNPDATIINYDVWIDGRSEIKYLSAADAIKNFFSGTSVGSCAYSKLKIHEGPMVTNPYYTYYYNTNQGLETILDYISNNTSFTRPTEIDQYQNISCQTTISRIYIQASKIDPETGDRLYGAVSYVDLSNNIPTVYEGETIEDIPPSDPNDGATTDTAQPFTVSGDNIVYNYPVTNNEGGNGYNGGGLIVPTSGLLSAGLALIQAVMELIRSWFLLHLVPFITLGFTGHF